MCKVCSFLGHRKINVTEEFKKKVTETIEDLIVNHNVSEFLFGSRSDFDTLCHSIVTELKEKYPKIKRIVYTCASESFVLESDREKMEKLYTDITNREIHLRGFEEEFEHKTKYSAGRASYIERNYAMIDKSNYCVFYYDKNYQTQVRQRSKQGCYYQPNSGTALAYKYATRKKKEIINLI
ncbi:MAG: SLOG family protein [Christensenellales bacterium]